MKFNKIMNEGRFPEQEDGSLFYAFFREFKLGKEHMNKEKVCSYLKTHCYGRKNVISADALEKSLRMSSTELRKQISRLRHEGVPIASSSSGYFYAATAAEVYSTIRSLEKMRYGLGASIEGLEKALGNFGDVP